MAMRRALVTTAVFETTSRMVNQAPAVEEGRGNDERGEEGKKMEGGGAKKKKGGQGEVKEGKGRKRDKRGGVRRGNT